MMLGPRIARLVRWHESLDPGGRAWLGFVVKFARPPRPIPDSDSGSRSLAGELGLHGPLAPRAVVLGLALLGAASFSAPARAEEGVRVRAERIVHELEAKKTDLATLQATLDRARQALERASNARRAGDHLHGGELEALALELAESAADLLRAQRAQTQVTEIERKAVDAETRVLRVRALVEQTAARRGRAAERLHEVEAEKAKPNAGAAAPKAATEKANADKKEPVPSKAAKRPTPGAP
jgi:DNA repair exonuclease SbcCD ATPase subunit